jgi:hypothetical protein
MNGRLRFGAEPDHSILFPLDGLQTVPALQTRAAALAEGVLVDGPEGAPTGGLRILTAQMVPDPTAVPATLGVLLQRRREELETRKGLLKQFRTLFAFLYGAGALPVFGLAHQIQAA